MGKKIALIVLLLAAEAGLGYYSLAVNGGLFSRFMFFLLSAGLVCVIVIKGIPYVLPDEESYPEIDQEKEEEKENHK